jgi:SAM-dependent methyltransferase
MTAKPATDQFIDYDHDRNQHSLEGARAALSFLFRAGLPGSLLDVGCGRGMWVKSAMDMGVSDVYGVDGVDIPVDHLHFPRERFQQVNLAGSWDLGRKFDMILCLEVAEHVDASVSELLVRGLVKHGDRVVFSAACPGQAGQHHVNCQWPGYWQQRFNANGFVCDDAIRWQIWNETAIEPWYRQNMFIARNDPKGAGSEPRIRPVLHPEFVDCTDMRTRELKFLEQIEDGCLSTLWYVSAPFKAFCHKAGRRFRWAKKKTRPPHP